MYIKHKANTSIYRMCGLFILTLIILGFTHCVSNKKTVMYDDPDLQNFQIYCNKDSLRYLYANYKDNTYIPVKILVDGDTTKGRMRIRGDSSRKDAKKSLKLKFMKNGKSKTLNFNAEYSDKSVIRQFLSTQIMSASGQNCFNSRFTNIFVNDVFFGLYLQVENMDAQFLERNLLPDNGNLYKATKDGACLSIFETVEEKWEQKNGAHQDFDDLKTLINELNSISNKDYFDFVQENFNYFDFVNMIALNIYLANGSTYYHNYYLYHHSNGKWELLPWDMDKSLSYYDWMPYQYHRTSSEWESDNPLIEKAFLNRKVFKDIKSRIKELAKTTCSENEIVKLIEKLELLLNDSVEKDTTDQITDTREWKRFLEREKNFIATRDSLLQQQFSSWPTTFEIKRLEQKVCNEILFEWTSSKSPKGKDITYILSISSDFLFQDKTKLITRTTKDTAFVFSENLPEGKYYWKVTADDGDFLVDGFNSKNIFEKVNCTALPAEINTDFTLTKEGGPYLINDNVFVKETGSLIINSGVCLYFNFGKKIESRGNLLLLGTEKQPIIFKNNSIYSFTYIHLIGGAHKIFNVNVFNGKLLAESAKNIQIDNLNLSCGLNNWLDSNPGVFLKFSNTSLKNSYLFSAHTHSKNHEGIVVIGGLINITNCIVENLPDAIELTVSHNSKVSDCKILNSIDDGIDINACENVVIDNVYIFNSNDKGVSIGGDQSFDAEKKFGSSKNIVLKNSVIERNQIGVSVKDSSSVLIESCRFNNNFIDVEAIEKYTPFGGGFVTLKRNRISGKVNSDSCSKILYQK